MASDAVVLKLIELLNQWGWEAGSAKLEQELGKAAGGEAAQSTSMFFQAWLAAERGEFAVAEGHLASIADMPFLCGWAMFVRAFVAFRQKLYDDAHRFLNEAELIGPEDPAFP